MSGGDEGQGLMESREDETHGDGSISVKSLQAAPGVPQEKRL